MKMVHEALDTVEQNEYGEMKKHLIKVLAVFFSGTPDFVQELNRNAVISIICNGFDLMKVVQTIVVRGDMVKAKRNTLFDFDA